MPEITAAASLGDMSKLLMARVVTRAGNIVVSADDRTLVTGETEAARDGTPVTAGLTTFVTIARITASDGLVTVKTQEVFGAPNCSDTVFEVGAEEIGTATLGLARLGGAAEGITCT